HSCVSSVPRPASVHSALPLHDALPIYSPPLGASSYCWCSPRATAASTRAVFQRRSPHHPQAGHVNCSSNGGTGLALTCPHAEQVLPVAACLSATCTWQPYHAALDCNCQRISPRLASASTRFRSLRTRFGTSAEPCWAVCWTSHPSTPIRSCEWTRREVSLCVASRRRFATRACSRATRAAALACRLDPGWQRARAR